MAFERGLLILGAGDNTIRLSPPLTITRNQADFAMYVLEECFAAIGQPTYWNSPRLPDVKSSHWPNAFIY